MRLISPNIGSVPNANANIINDPLRKLPDVNAKPCAINVNPHGRKNVRAPTRNGILLPLNFSSEEIPRVKNLGRAILNLYAHLIPSICSPSTSIIAETIITTTAVKAGALFNEMPNADPKAPKSPPRITKERSLPTLNIVNGFSL